MSNTDNLIGALSNAVEKFRTQWVTLQRQFANSLSLKQNLASSIASSFDMKDPSLHGAVFAEFGRIFSALKTEDFDAMYSAWSVAAKYGRKYPPQPRTPERTALLGNGLILASFLLFNGELYRALRVTSQLLVLGEKSVHLFLCALNLSIELREFEIYKVLRTLRSTKCLVPSVAYWLNAMDLFVEAHTATGDELKSLVTKAWELIRSIAKLKTTYASSYGEIAARQVLIFASKSPQIDISVTGDTLCHLQRSYELSVSTLRAVVGPIYDKKMVHLFDAMPNDIFEKVFYIHSGVACHIYQAYESLDCGIAAETECRFLRILTNGFWMMYPFAIMHSLNMFALIKWMTISKDDHTTRVFSWLRDLQAINFCNMHQLENRLSGLIISGLSSEVFREFYKFIVEKMIPQWKIEREISALSEVEPKKSKALNSYAASYLMRATSQVYFRTDVGRRLLQQRWQSSKQVILSVLELCSKYAGSFRAQWLLLRHLIRIDETTTTLKNESSGTPTRSVLGTPTTPGRTFTKSPARSRVPTPYRNASPSRMAQNSEDKENCLELEKQLKVDVVAAYEELKMFAHLLYIDWRRQISAYLATNVQTVLGSSRPLHVATFLADSMAVSLRAETRMRAAERLEAAQLLNWKEAGAVPESMEEALSTLKIDDPVQKFGSIPMGYFGCSEDMKRFINNIPPYLTVIQLSFDSRDNLWLTRFHRDRDPYSIQLSYIVNQGVINDPPGKGDPMLAQFVDILRRNDQSTKENQNDAKRFWETRRALNAEMAELVERMENKWLGPLWPLTIPFNATTTEPAEASWLKISHAIRRKIQKLGLSPDAAFMLTHLLDHIEEGDDWAALMIAIGAFEDADVEAKMSEPKIVELFTQLKTKMKTGREERLAGESYVFLAIPPTLSVVPWECMHAFTGVLVSRIPSIFTMDALLNKHLMVPKPVNARSSYYVLNPESNLAKTQERLEAKIATWNWEGISGTVPDRKELVRALNSNDLYIYVGHGSGRRYIGTANDVRRLECRSVCLLMGCSSVEITQEGRGWDGRSTVYELLTARCPAVIGFLWMVTDGDADRFFLALMENCFEAVERGEIDYRVIMRGMAKARTACKLDMLTGSAAVCYGLPIFTHFETSEDYPVKKAQRNE